MTRTLDFRRGPLHLALAAVCALCSVASARPPAPTELALRNGAVYTLDGARSWAQAVAIRAGRIVYVGTDAELAPYLGGRTRALVTLFGGRPVHGDLAAL